jgi:hypothetical protein
VRLSPRRAWDKGFTLEAVEDVLDEIGTFTSINTIRCEGSLACVFATAESWAVHRDVLTIPWGKDGQRRSWPDWRVDRAHPTAPQRRSGALHDIVKLKAIPVKGNGHRLEWRDVARTLKRLGQPRYYVQVRGAARLTATIEIHVPAGNTTNVRKALDELKSIKNGADAWNLQH